MVRDGMSASFGVSLKQKLLQELDTGSTSEIFGQEAASAQEGSGRGVDERVCVNSRKRSVSVLLSMPDSSCTEAHMSSDQFVTDLECPWQGVGRSRDSLSCPSLPCICLVFVLCAHVLK